MARTELFSRKQPGGVYTIEGIDKQPGAVFFVHSGTGTDGSGYGKNPDSPCATIDYAIGLCTANKGDVIYILPGHAETIAAASAINCDVIGISIIGLGNGANRPTVTSGTDTATTVAIGAANVKIKGLVFVCGIDEQVIMIDVNAADVTIEDCEFRGSAAAQPLDIIDINGGGANVCDRATVRRCKFTSYTAAGAANEAIELGEVANEVLIEDCIIDGDWGNAGIHNPVGKVLTNLRILRNVVRNRQTGDHAIELVSACTGEAVGNMLCADTAAAIFDPGSLFCAGNTYSQAIDQESFGYVPLWPAAAVPGNGASLQSVLRDVWDAVRNGTGGSEPGVNKSVIDAIGFDGVAAVAASAGMLRTMTGTYFVVKKSLTSSAVVTGGVDVTGASSVGAIQIVDVLCQTDATGLATGTNFTLETNNANGPAVFFAEAVANLGASTLIDLDSASVTSKTVVLETGKKVIAKATAMDCTGAGVVDVYLICRRLADNATLAAA